MANPKVEQIFTYHTPFGDQRERYEDLRAEALVFAQQIERQCPPSRERSLAITSLQETVMWANASIAINEAASPYAPAVVLRAEVDGNVEDFKHEARIQENLIYKRPPIAGYDGALDSERPRSETVDA